MDDEFAEENQHREQPPVLGIRLPESAKIATIESSLLSQAGSNQDKVMNHLLTEEALGTFTCGGSSLTASYGCGGSGGSSSSTLGISSRSRSRSSGSFTSCQIGVSDGGSDSGDTTIDARGPTRSVTFCHGVHIREEWRQYLATRGYEPDTERGRAATMVDGDDFWSLVEEASSRKEVRKAFAPPHPWIYSRAAYFAAMEYDGRDTGEDFVKPTQWGRMQEIVSSGRGRIHRDDAERLEEVDEEKEEDQGRERLLDQYDGTLAGMKNFIFPPANSRSRSKHSRPPTKLLDTRVPRSPVEWMTPSQLDAILGRVKGWKDGSVHWNSSIRRIRRMRRHSQKRCDVNVESGGMAEEVLPATTEGSGLKGELFILAMEEHRTSLLFKRAFLNRERDDTCM